MRPATQVTPPFDSRYGGSVHTQSTLSSGMSESVRIASPTYIAESPAGDAHAGSSELMSGSGE